MPGQRESADRVLLEREPQWCSLLARNTQLPRRDWLQAARVGGDQCTKEVMARLTFAGDDRRLMRTAEECSTARRYVT